MPVFEFQGYRAEGKKASGIVDADSPKAARIKLRRQGILATKVALDTGARELQRSPVATLLNRITVRDISGFTRQLATLQSAGLTLVESLDALIEQAANVRFKKIVTDIREQVTHGSSLADAMALHPAQFDEMYVSLVRAGEASGALGETLTQLAEFNERRQRQRSKVTAAMIYPAIMTVVGSGVLVFLMGYVVPKTQAMFEDMNQALPLPTVILLAVSDFLTNWWVPLAVVAVVALFALRQYARTERGRKRLDTLRLSAPVFGPLYRTAAIARFAGALGTLLAGGVELVAALRITEKAVGNAALAGAVDRAIVNITEGETIAEPLRQSGMFPPVVTQMIAAGEKSGALERMLEKISEAYEFEVETTVTALTSMVEPVLILVMGTVVGFIVLAILLPIFELSQVIH